MVPCVRCIISITVFVLLLSFCTSCFRQTKQELMTQHYTSILAYRILFIAKFGKNYVTVNNRGRFEKNPTSTSNFTEIITLNWQFLKPILTWTVAFGDQAIATKILSLILRLFPDTTRKVTINLKTIAIVSKPKALPVINNTTQRGEHLVTSGSQALSSSFRRAQSVSKSLELVIQPLTSKFGPNIKISSAHSGSDRIKINA